MLFYSISYNNTIEIMKSAFYNYMIAVLLIVCWTICFFMFKMSFASHLILIAALSLLTITIIKKEKID